MRKEEVIHWFHLFQYQVFLVWFAVCISSRFFSSSSGRLFLKIFLFFSFSLSGRSSYYLSVLRTQDFSVRHIIATSVIHACAKRPSKRNHPSNYTGKIKWEKWCCWAKKCVVSLSSFFLSLACSFSSLVPASLFFSCCWCQHENANSRSVNST